MITTPHDVALQEHTLRVLKFRRDAPAGYQEPVLFCYALVNRPYILDLQSDRSVVRQFLNRGFDVYLIDWGVPTDSDHVLTLHDYVCKKTRLVADLVASHSSTGQFHLLGYCMGGTLSSMFTAIFPEMVRTLSLLATPIDFGGNESLLQVWADPRYFDVDALVDAYGNCPAALLQMCFQFMRPVQNFVTKYATFAEKQCDARFVQDFLALERWTCDSIPVAGETFREFVKKLYQQNQLVRGELRLKDVAVQLSRIACPLLLLTATGDHLVPPSQSTGILPHVGSADVATLSIDAGHVGLAVSSRAHGQLWPRATQWVADRSTPCA